MDMFDCTSEYNQIGPFRVIIAKHQVSNITSFQFFALSYYMYLRSEFRVMMSVTISARKTVFGSSLPPVVCKITNVLFTLFVFICVQWCLTHIVLFLFCLSLSCCQFLWMCPFLNAPSVFSNVYVQLYYERGGGHATFRQHDDNVRSILD